MFIKLMIVVVNHDHLCKNSEKMKSNKNDRLMQVMRLGEREMAFDDY
jgi:hypothetical protein